MKTKLQILEEKIRKDLPRLMELGEGCRVKLADHKKTSDPNNIIKMVNAFTFKSEDIVEIIGHDILLSDVLDWLKTLRKNFKLDSDILVVFVDAFTLKKSNINLSKPYLKDQSEELIEFLYNLIEK